METDRAGEWPVPSERGEFHTCATSGPMFQRGLDASVGEVVEREGFVYADLLLDE